MQDSFYLSLCDFLGP